MTCKDCLHYEVCYTWARQNLPMFLLKPCGHFKDHSKWVEQKHERWRKFFRYNCGIKKADGFTAGCCGRWVKNPSRFCPNCGADMRERKDNAID